MDAKSFGTTIKAWRIENDLSQEELGDLAGLNKKIMGNIERGQRMPDKLEIVRLCHALGKTPAELMVGWYRSFLEDLNELEGELLNSSKPSPRNAGGSQAPPAAPGSKINQIIDKLAALTKELYQESRAEAQKNFLDWLAQTGLLNSFPPPGAPRQTRKRVRRKRGPAKA
jgi:transcriptional regulator with XRE-family HTH domain